MKNYLKLIRIKHWLKNGLIFLPIFFSINLLDFSLFSTCLIAFIIFSLSSSIVYIINDLNDIEKDRLHPVKRNRPLASGTIKKSQALIVVFAFLILIISMMIYLYSREQKVSMSF